MTEGRFTADDSAERKMRLDYAELRLSGWARWSGTNSPDLVGFSSTSSFASAMTPQNDELQAGARHCASECSDEEAEEVDSILAGWKTSHRFWFRMVRKEYFTYGPQEKKARELGISRDYYRDELVVLKSVMYVELIAMRRRRQAALASARSCAKKPVKLGQPPAKNART
jgi:hypothetical protein